MKKKVKKTSAAPNVKDTTYNYFYNIIIFVLSVFIIYLLYSAFLKITHYSPEEKFDEEVMKSSESIQLDVLNGCGVSGVADRFTDFLRAHDFDVVQIGNYRSFDVDQTFIIDRIGNRANALKLAKAIGIENVKIVQQLSDDYFLDLSLVIGKDFNKLKPITGGE